MVTVGAGSFLAPGSLSEKWMSKKRSGSISSGGLVPGRNGSSSPGSGHSSKTTRCLQPGLLRRSKH